MRRHRVFVAGRLARERALLGHVFPTVGTSHGQDRGGTPLHHLLQHIPCHASRAVLRRREKPPAGAHHPHGPCHPGARGALSSEVVRREPCTSYNAVYFLTVISRLLSGREWELVKAKKKALGMRLLPLPTSSNHPCNIWVVFLTMPPLLCLHLWYRRSSLPIPFSGRKRNGVWPSLAIGAAPAGQSSLARPLPPNPQPAFPSRRNVGAI